VERRGGRISYIKKPFARGSLICLPAAVLALILGGISLYLSISRAGQGDLNVGAWGFSSLTASVVSLVYGGLSLLEKEKNYILAKIGLGIGGATAVFWACMILVGLAG